MLSSGVMSHTQVHEFDVTSDSYNCDQFAGTGLLVHVHVVCDHDVRT